MAGKKTIQKDQETKKTATTGKIKRLTKKELQKVSGGREGWKKGQNDCNWQPAVNIRDHKIMSCMTDYGFVTWKIA